MRARMRLRARPTRLGLAVGCSALLMLTGCKGCRGEEVAELRGLVGSVQRDFAAAPGTWRSAPSGSFLRVGDGLRTGPSSRAELQLIPEGRLRVEADTVIRFSDVPPSAQHNAARTSTVEVETGSVELESGGVDLLIDSPRGVARVSKNSRVRVRRTSGAEIDVEVAVGRAEIEDGDTIVRAGEGETLAFAAGDVVVQTTDQADTSASAEVDEPTAVPSALAVVDELGVEPSLTSFELELLAGETATVHDPRTPIAVALRARDCSGAAELELREARGTRRVRSAGPSPAVRLAAGSYRYTVRCLSTAAGTSPVSGVLRIVRDSGARSLPRTAPKITLEADGRRYNLRYQNLLPELRLRWPDAPVAASYTLELVGESGASVREKSAKPEIMLRSGRVRDGDYRFVITAGTTSSKETSLRVTFDDSARTAQLLEPRDLGFAPGTSVRVVGAALAGSSVRVGEVVVAPSSEGRFQAVVTAPPAGRALWVRVQHAVAGVHYYVRRPGS